MASSDGRYETVFRKIVHDQNAQRWRELETSLQPTVVVDGCPAPKGRFRGYLLGDHAGDEGEREVRIDAILVDANTHSIAARLINRVTLGDSSEPFEYQEVVFAKFTDNLLSSWQTLRDEDGFRNREPSVASTPSSPPSPSSSDANQLPLSKTLAELDIFYRGYIKTINEKTMAQEFDRFCRQKLQHNGRELTIAEYIPLISDSQDAIEGLHFRIQEVFTDASTQQIGARLEFTGTPVNEWGGAKPNGESVVFHEHVMYQLEHGRISRVWSTIELDVYRSQMGTAAP
ncbi:SnoaL-like polyketide cyclase [Colletotrichum higginsianum]|uniref:SnoaL-like polyketide cyclase n=2 Tax=Colletotrichum higginsianum TaxID=80884 RepID=H1UWM7_COLHI|nr:SnoaL-like polyketide cyclase [Colletotrichum higginsianum IMI 349063]OBR04677.1 SnoaL-like polyketide cyclase [Colletotrichum higginsianum IMI 349063]TIC94172.1 hypothetical protein CH35J_009111 [Colletotrichum higginsianum]CCF32378.1 SnoaL-like polyketide cyclase [Colletotrichum higginsianum]